MFSEARLKLTAWYVFILMLVSGLFSIVIYRGADIELQRLEHRQQLRMDFFRSQFLLQPEMVTPEPIDEIRQHVIFTLLAINAGIFVVGGVAGYILAGQTLQPIQDMVDDQNRFITDASHELRTPITAIKTETEVGLRDKKLTLAEARTLLTSNLEETNRLAAISDKLLNLAQLQKPAAFIFTNASASKLVDDAIGKVEPMAKIKQITLTSHIYEAPLLIDKDRFTEALITLLDNAIKYSPEGKEVTIEGKKIDHSYLFSIKDQGIGIHKTDLPHIFDRFYRAEKSRTKDTIPGYGLGLSIAKKIIEEHNGSIAAKSTPGKGTTFFIRLPVGTKNYKT